MVSVRLLIVLFAFSIGVDVARAAGSTYLLSIVGISLAKNEEIAGIDLKVQSLELLAVCRIPEGWSVNADSPPGPTAGVVAGANGDIADVDARNVADFRGWILVRQLYGAPRITGSIDVDIFPGAPDATRRKLFPTNIVLEPAGHCPVPKPG